MACRDNSHQRKFLVSKFLSNDSVNDDMESSLGIVEAFYILNFFRAETFSCNLIPEVLLLALVE